MTFVIPQYVIKMSTNNVVRRKLKGGSHNDIHISKLTHASLRQIHAHNIPPTCQPSVVKGNGIEDTFEDASPKNFFNLKIRVNPIVDKL